MSVDGFTLSSALTDGSGTLTSSLPIEPLVTAVNLAAAGLSGRESAGLEQTLRSAIDEALHIDLNSVLGGAWARVTAVGTAMKATAADPASVAIVPLLDHSVTSRHAPHLDLIHAGQSLAQLTIDIVLTLTLKGLTLDVRGGRIVGAKSGYVVAEAMFSFLGQTLAKKTSEPIHLPGSIRSGMQSDSLPTP